MLEIIKNLASNTIIQAIISIFGLTSIYFIIDKFGVSAIKLLFKNERILLEAIDYIDEKYIDSLEKDFKSTHSELEARLISLCDKIQDKIRD